MSRQAWLKQISTNNFRYILIKAAKVVLLDQIEGNAPITRLLQCETASEKLLEIAANHCFSELNRGFATQEDIDKAKERLKNETDKLALIPSVPHFVFGENKISFHTETTGMMHDTTTSFSYTFSVCKNEKGEEEYWFQQHVKNNNGEEYRIEKLFNKYGLQLEERYAKGKEGQMISGYIVKRPEITKENLEEIYTLLYTPYETSSGEKISIGKDDRITFDAKGRAKTEKRYYYEYPGNPCFIPEIDVLKEAKKGPIALIDETFPGKGFRIRKLEKKNTNSFFC